MRILLTIVTLLTFSSLLGQNWINKAGGPSHDEAFDVEVDQFGNIYTVGYVSGAIEFGDDISLVANGFSDIYISKSNSSGDFQWVKTFGGSLSDRATNLDVGPDGNIYVTGYFQGEANFDGTTYSSVSGSRDFFVCKLNTNGDLLWLNVEGGDGAEIASGIAIGIDNSVVITGEFSGNTSIGFVTMQSAYDDVADEFSKDIFVAKYSSGGAFMWAKQGSSDKNDRGLAIDIDVSNNIYITGQISDTLFFGSNTINNGIINAGFVARLDASGNVSWFTVLSAFEVMAYDVKTDLDRLYLTGEYLGQMVVQSDPVFTLGGNYSHRMFLMQMDLNGQVNWAEEDDSDSKVSPKSMCIDVNRDVYLGGIFKCRFDEYSDDLDEDGLFYSAGFNDVFITKYSEDGDRMWFRQYGGPGQDFCAGITISQVDQPIIAGAFEYAFNAPFSSPFASSFDLNVTSMSTPCGNNINYAFQHNDDNFEMLLAKPFQNTAPHYFYFLGDCYDFVLPAIEEGQDSLIFCGLGNLYGQTNTFGNGYLSEYNYIGPCFDFSWNTGSVEPGIEVTSTGDYFIEMSRKDLCYSELDSVHITINPIPEMPLLTDDGGFNTSSSVPYSNLAGCGEIYNASLETDSTQGIVTVYPPSGVPFEYADTFAIDAPGSYSVGIINEFGCQSGGSFTYNLFTPNPPEIIDPVLLHAEGLDTAIICFGEGITFHIYDLITNPELDLSQPYCLGNLYPTLPTDCIDYSFSPLETGWYYPDYFFILGYNNICGIDSLHYYPTSDSIYVIVNPNPWVNIQVDGDDFLCPGDTSNVWTSNLVDGFSWYGPGIVSYSEGGDTISVIEEGTYGMSGSITDPETGCSSSINSSYYVQNPDNPIIYSNVPDNLICPNDSLLLTCETSITYSWVGPDGDFLGDTQSIYAAQPGFYYCVVLDDNGCTLTSNTLELLSYTSPFVIIDPSGDLCFTGSVTLSTIVSGSPSLWWDAPISSSAEEIIVFEPGEYTVTVEQCEISYSETIEIVDNSFDAIISVYPEETTCVGDTIILTGNDDLLYYEWSNGENTQTIIVTESGDYTLSAINPFGCEDDSETISLEFILEVLSPIPLDTAICQGTDLVLLPDESSSAQWFDEFDNLLFEGSSYTINNVMSPSTLYYTNVFGSCISESSPINISLLQAPDIPIIDVPSLLCALDSIVIEYLNWNETYSSWVGDIGYEGPGGTLGIVLPDTTVAITAINTLPNGCITEITTDLTPNPLPFMPLIDYNYPLCDEDTLILNATIFQTSVQTIWEDPLGIQVTTHDWNYGIVTSGNSGIYSFTITDTLGCFIKIDLPISVNPYPILDLDLDTNYCFDEPLEIIIPAIYQTYDWSTGATSNNVTIPEPGTYTLSVSVNQCFVNDTFVVTSYDCNEPIWPNVFTPNGDQLNDHLYFSSPLAYNVKVEIYNRWGQLVSEFNGEEKYWDGTHILSGKPLSTGTYYYVVRFEDFTGYKKSSKGYIALIR